MRRIILITACVCIVLTYLAFLVPVKELRAFITEEDCLFENIGAISCFLAAAAFFLKYKRDQEGNDFGRERTKKNIFFLLLAIGLFFIGGEEIAWGQRILGIALPVSWEKINDQGDLSLHNIVIFKRKTIFSFNFLLTMAFLVYAGLVPIMEKFNSRFAAFLRKINLPTIPTGFCVLSILNIVSLHVIKWNLTRPYSQPIAEIKESNLEFILMMVALWYLFEDKKVSSSHRLAEGR